MGLRIITDTNKFDGNVLDCDDGSIEFAGVEGKNSCWLVSDVAGDVLLEVSPGQAMELIKKLSQIHSLQLKDLVK